MKKEYLSNREAVCSITLFSLGTSVVLGGYTMIGQDSWIAMVSAMVLVAPVCLLYGRIMQLFPEEDIFQIIIRLFGKFFGKCIAALFTWYCVHLSALVFRNFSEFISIVSMPTTPQIAFMILMMLASIYAIKSPIRTIGRASLILLPIVVSIMVITFLMLLKQVQFSNFLPVMDHSAKEILSGSYSILTFPLAESVVFLTMADSIKKTQNPIKIYFFGLGLAAILLLFIIVRNTLALGAEMQKHSYFPSYVAARIINVADFIGRIEGSISVNFILTGLSKITICLIGASKGLACLFNIEDFKKMSFPAGLLSISLSSILYINVMDMFGFIKYYPYYAIPFEFMIPVLIWIVGEISVHIKNRGKSAPLPENSSS